MEALQAMALQAKTSKMRWVFFLALFFSCAKAPSDPGVHDYQRTVPPSNEILIDAILKEYAPEAKVYVIYEQPLSYNILGLANQVGPHTYLIQINSSNFDVRSTIYHELGHIIDAELGRLDFREPMRWYNIPCDWTIAWHERPWEVSANQWRDCLIYEYENGQLEHYPYSILGFTKKY